jgi:hypothetical protein
MANQFVIKNGLKVASGGINTTGDLSITGSLVVTGTITAESYIVSSSVTHKTTTFSSGSTQFGDTSNDTHGFTGSMDVTQQITTPDIKLTGLSNAGVDTDKFLVLDSNSNVDFRTGAQVRSDIGAVAIGNEIHPIQLTIDTKNSPFGYVAFSGLADLQSLPNRAFTTFIAPCSGYIQDIIVSPEQTNTVTDDCNISLYNGGTQQSTTNTETLQSAGTNVTFNFGALNYSFSSGDRLSLEFDKLTNTADLYNIMIVLRLTS